MSRIEAPRFNDRIIDDGFPSGWFVQDRVCQNEALLCRRSDFSFFGSVCICTRPRAMHTDDWISIAQTIAIGFEAENNRRIQARSVKPDSPEAT